MSSCIFSFLLFQDISSSGDDFSYCKTGRDLTRGVPDLLSGLSPLKSDSQSHDPLRLVLKQNDSRDVCDVLTNAQRTSTYHENDSSKTNDIPLGPVIFQKIDSTELIWNYVITDYKGKEHIERKETNISNSNKSIGSILTVTHDHKESIDPFRNTETYRSLRDNTIQSEICTRNKNISFGNIFEKDTFLVSCEIESSSDFENIGRIDFKSSEMAKDKVLKMELPPELDVKTHNSRSTDYITSKTENLSIVEHKTCNASGPDICLPSISNDGKNMAVLNDSTNVASPLESGDVDMDVVTRKQGDRTVIKEVHNLEEVSGCSEAISSQISVTDSDITQLTSLDELDQSNQSEETLLTSLNSLQRSIEMFTTSSQGDNNMNKSHDTQSDSLFTHALGGFDDVNVKYGPPEHNIDGTHIMGVAVLKDARESEPVSKPGIDTEGIQNSKGNSTLPIKELLQIVSEPVFFDSNFEEIQTGKNCVQQAEQYIKNSGCQNQEQQDFQSATLAREVHCKETTPSRGIATSSLVHSTHPVADRDPLDEYSPIELQHCDRITDATGLHVTDNRIPISHDLVEGGSDLPDSASVCSGISQDSLCQDTLCEDLSHNEHPCHFNALDSLDSDNLTQYTAQIEDIIGTADIACCSKSQVDNDNANKEIVTGLNEAGHGQDKLVGDVSSRVKDIHSTSLNVTSSSNVELNTIKESVVARKTVAIEPVFVKHPLPIDSVGKDNEQDEVESNFTDDSIEGYSVSQIPAFDQDIISTPTHTQAEAVTNRLPFTWSDDNNPALGHSQSGLPSHKYLPIQTPYDDTQYSQLSHGVLNNRSFPQPGFKTVPGASKRNPYTTLSPGYIAESAIYYKELLDDCSDDDVSLSSDSLCDDAADFDMEILTEYGDQYSSQGYLQASQQTDYSTLSDTTISDASETRYTSGGFMCKQYAPRQGHLDIISEDEPVGQHQINARSSGHIASSEQRAISLSDEAGPLLNTTICHSQSGGPYQYEEDTTAL